MVVCVCTGRTPEFSTQSYLVDAASSRNGKEAEKEKDKIVIQIGRQQKIKGVEWRQQDKLEPWIR